MSASQHPNALDNQGKFSSKVPPSQPLTYRGHKPGVKFGSDAAPEFSAKTCPPGTAPREDTFQPNPEAEISGQALSSDSENCTDPLDFGGATSGTVHNHTQFGRPELGETSSEQNGSKKRDPTGVGGHLMSGNSGRQTDDGSVKSKIRGLEADPEGHAGELTGQKGHSGSSEGGSGNLHGAEEALPVTSEQLASGFC